MAQFAIGDFLLYAGVSSSSRNKLKVLGLGPATVVDTTFNWFFVARGFCTDKVSKVQASCLKFYADEHLKVFEELVKYATDNSEGYVVATNICEDVSVLLKRIVKGRAH
ncbi:unnamed protein product [Globisporangium polare]